MVRVRVASRSTFDPSIPSVSSESAFVGEAIQLQIQVSGTKQVEPPNMAVLTDFTVTPAGGGPQSNTSVRIVNGQVSKTEFHGYIFNFRIVPKREVF